MPQGLSARTISMIGLAAATALGGTSAAAQTRAAADGRSRVFENPPVAAVRDAQPPAAVEADSLEALQAPSPVADADPRETIAYDLTIGVATAPIYNPWTLGYDQVALRSYFQQGMAT